MLAHDKYCPSSEVGAVVNDYFSWNLIQKRFKSGSKCMKTIKLGANCQSNLHYFVERELEWIGETRETVEARVSNACQARFSLSNLSVVLFEMLLFVLRYVSKHFF